MRKMKAWILFSGFDDYLTGRLCLENGWIPFMCLCSKPSEMKDRLYTSRKDRQAVFAAMGIDIDIQGEPFDETIPTPTGDTLKKKREAEGWRPFEAEYLKTRKQIEGDE